MTTTTPSTVLAVPDLVFTDPERLALAGFLAGHRGLTRDAYALDLRQFVSWCERHSLKLFSVHRTDIELYARALEEAGLARPPWPGACALWRASTATPKRKVWSRSPRLSTSGVPCGARLREPRCRPRPQRGRCSARRCWSRRASRARPHLTSGAERPPGVRGDWCRHRGPWPGAGPPHLDRPSEGRKDRHGTAGTADGPRG